MLRDKNFAYLNFDNYSLLEAWNDLTTELGFSSVNTTKKYMDFWILECMDVLRILESKEKVYWDDRGLRNLMAEGGMDSYIFPWESFLQRGYKPYQIIGYEYSLNYETYWYKFSKCSPYVVTFASHIKDCE